MAVTSSSIESRLERPLEAHCQLTFLRLRVRYIQPRANTIRRLQQSAIAGGYGYA